MGSTEIENEHFNCFELVEDKRFVLKLIKPSLKGWNELVFYTKQIDGDKISRDYFGKCKMSDSERSKIYRMLDDRKTVFTDGFKSFLPKFYGIVEICPKNQKCLSYLKIQNLC